MALRLPIFATSDLTNIATPGAGDLIWNSDDLVPKYHDGTSWMSLVGPAGAGILIARYALSESGVSTTVRRLPAISRIWRLTTRSDSTGRMPRGASRSWT